jgi:hypothetical protein
MKGVFDQILNADDIDVLLLKVESSSPSQRAGMLTILLHLLERI